jgi:ATP-dependent DNA helicase DinG
MNARETIERLLRSAEGIEYRPSQIEAAVAIYDACLAAKPLIVEAGTGTGKTLAYLLAFHLLLKEHPGARLCVATYTRALQDQICAKDLPFIKAILGDLFPFRFGVAYGSGNYLCRYRFDRFTPELSRKEEWERLNAWAEDTREGLFQEIELHPSVREEINRDPELCLRRRCPSYAECFYYRNRSRLRKMNLVVLNHHLLFSSIAAGGESLPAFDFLVLDEAHQVEEVATAYFQTEISRRKTVRFLESVSRGRRNLLRSSSLPPDAVEELSRLIGTFEKEFLSWFDTLAEFAGDGDKTRVREPLELDASLLERSADEIRMALERRQDEAESGDGDDESSVLLQAIGRRIAAIRAAVREFIDRKHPDDIYTIERARADLLFRIVPLSVAERFQSSVLDKMTSVIFTSATLSVGSTFEYFQSLVSTSKEPMDGLICPQIFDFKSNVMLYVPEPGHEVHEDPEAIAAEVRAFAELTDGGMFVLFTNNAVMREVHGLLADSIEQPVLVQEPSVSNYQLVERFLRTPRAVLLGNMSFWQGVDIPDNRLRCVVITRLPFRVPSDPVVEARSEYWEREKGSGFAHYALPKAVIMLKQGFGRLVRGSGDHGIVAVLDTRLRTKSYGKIFFRSLPQVDVVSSREPLEVFLAGKRGKSGG